MEGMSIPVFKVSVEATSNRGFSPEELAEQALSKILYINPERDDAVSVQAKAFQNQIRKVLVVYMHQAIKSYKTTLCAELVKQGHEDMANIVQRI